MKKLLIFLFFTLTLTHTVFAADYDGHWAEDEIEFAVSNHLASGVSEDLFLPDAPITRCEFTALTVRYQNLFSSSFSCTLKDADSTAWYYPYLVIAENNRIIFGDSDGFFYPNEPMTRQDALVLLCRAYDIHPQPGSFRIDYTDASEISSYAKSAVSFALVQKLFFGYRDGTLRPKETLTRAEAIVLLNRFYQNSSAFAAKPEFLKNYPRIAAESSVGSISIAVKTNIPCTVYYKAIPTSLYESGITPNPNSFTQSFTQITNSETEILETLYLDTEEEYTLYLMAVTSGGLKSKIAKITTVKPMIYEKGNGTAENPYQITNEQQLDYIRYFQNSHFRLEQDITLQKDWTPINAEAGFFGSIDGNGHTISNLRISETGENCGFFSYLSDGEIKNLTLSGTVFGESNVGMFAGISENSTLSGCAAIGTVQASKHRAGGLVGQNTGTIQNCLAALYQVSAISYAGGICGSNGGTIQNCISAAYAVGADMYASGIAGANFGGKISNNVSASFSTLDILTYGSGIITTNKQNGITENNYSYARTKKNSKEVLPTSDSIDGEPVSLDMLCSALFYTDRLGRDFFKDWKLASADDGFLLPYPKNLQKPSLTPGLTPYQPKILRTEQDLREMLPQNHYLLGNSITLSKETDWKPLFDTENPNDGFSGTFDGKSYTISGLRQTQTDGQGGLFGMIGDGIIKNLNLSDFQIFSSDTCGALAGTNYGRAENCALSNSVLSAKNPESSVSLGGLVGKNFGVISNVVVHAELSVQTKNSNLGGICGQNEGFLEQSYFFGSLKAEALPADSIAAIGGICGFQSGGFLYESMANATLFSEAQVSYLGGICGIQSDGELFKTASFGTLSLFASDASVGYCGGISGLSNAGLLVHSYSKMNLDAKSETSYLGGICGYNEACNLQNTYAVNSIVQIFSNPAREQFLGGICGCNQSGFISGSVSLNPALSSSGEAAKICPVSEREYLFGNFSQKETEPHLSSELWKNGTELSKNNLTKKDFYLLPVDRGGNLGWSSAEYSGEGGVWTMSSSPYPILNGVKYQDAF